MLFAVAALILAADIISKVIVVATLSGVPCRAVGNSGPVRVIGSVLTLCEERNAGAAFSIGGASTTVVFSVIAVGVIAFIIRTARRIYSLPWAIALGLLLGGALGNLTDRLFRSPGPLRGWVVDWIQLPHWPVFNLADSSIVCGGILMVALAMRGLRIDGTRQPVGGAGGDGAGPGRGPAPGKEPGPAGRSGRAERPAGRSGAGERPSTGRAG
jgi:lipoprotein signal peptidase